MPERATLNLVQQKNKNKNKKITNKTKTKQKKPKKQKRKKRNKVTFDGLQCTEKTSSQDHKC